jgi:transcriptional regulator with XRE-family HTH domain
MDRIEGVNMDVIKMTEEAGIPNSSESREVISIFDLIPDITPEMGALIRYAREEAGLSQSELAEGIGKRQASISDMENGKMQPDASTLSNLAIRLNKPVSYFFPDIIHRVAGPEGASLEEQELIILFRSLSDDKHMQKAIIAMVKGYIDHIRSEQYEAEIREMEEQEERARKQRYPGKQPRNK